LEMLLENDTACLPLLAPPLHMEEPKNSSNNCNCVVRRCK
jgi:hypothetical protein